VLWWVVRVWIRHHLPPLFTTDVSALISKGKIVANPFVHVVVAGRWGKADSGKWRLHYQWTNDAGHGVQLWPESRARSQIEALGPGLASN
jgi:hypothetical protein